MDRGGGRLSDNATASSKLTPEAIQYLVHHVFLPPKLPQESDSSEENDYLILCQVLEALRQFESINGSQNTIYIAPSIAMVGKIIKSRGSTGDLLEKQVDFQMSSMKDNDMLSFHLKAQNAGVFIRRQGDQYIFEVFEASCSNASVIGTEGRLRRAFPVEAISVSAIHIDNPTFRQPFADMLSKLDGSTPVGAHRIARKASAKLPEIRDAVDPRYVTELVFGILRGVGEPTDIMRVHKNVRDDVLWSDVLLPWRRSPLWTVLRVAVQITAMRLGKPEDGRSCFKAFMIYFMACILQQAVAADISSDTLFCMRAKIVRRLQKFNPSSEYPSPWLVFVMQMVRNTTEKLESRWDLIQINPDPFATQKGWNPRTLSFHDDIVLRLSSLQNHMKKVQSRKTLEAGTTLSKLERNTRITSSEPNLPSAVLLSACKSNDADRLLLADIETWVHRSLPLWQQNNIGRDTACSELAELITQYALVASGVYKEDPESCSVMFLTILELWVCFDKVSTYHEPILLDYETGFPPALFEPLLLPQKHQMQRLSAAEQYISVRKTRSLVGYPSVFHSFKTARSLPVRYFNQSASHQKLHQDILTNAAEEKEAKKRELANAKQTHSNLIKQASSLECEYITTYRWNKRTNATQERRVHSNSCKKCALNKRASNLSINYHEWPLPQDELEAKAVVFELDCPKTIITWRDTTYHVLVELFTPESSRRKAKSSGTTQGKKYYFKDSDGLRSYDVSMSKRLNLASIAKPMNSTHYKSPKVSYTTEGTICVQHAMHYDVYDSRSDILAKGFMDFCTIRELCTLKLPAGPYQRLQYSVNDTIHPPNRPLAEQFLCPNEFTLHEFIAFASLRAGHRLQWHNIGRSLEDGALNFNAEETSIAFAQASCQAGPSASDIDVVLRDTHVVLDDSKFCMDILQSLYKAMGSIEKNWQGATAARTFVLVAKRILSLSSDAQVQSRCLEFLALVRKATLRWTRELSEKLRNCDQESHRMSWTQSALEVALSCHGTFDVDSEHMKGLLKSGDNVAILIECAITTCDHCPTSRSRLPTHIQRLMIRFSRIAHCLQPELYAAILEDPRALDISIARLWASYKPGNGWTSVEGQSNDWITTKTSGDLTNKPVTVHFNLLNGCLLVDGSPLSRLPRTYESHDSYQRLFGAKVLNIIPSMMKGMRYGTRDDVHGYQVFFNMTGTELIIRVTKGEEVYEILPTGSLVGDFPPVFVKSYSHWLHIANNTIEFRPWASPWESHAQNWTLELFSSGRPILKQGAIRHIDMKSATAQAVSIVLSPIEEAKHIHISLDSGTGTLQVHLPRLKMDFFVNERFELESKQRRNMVIDASQSCGTFTGLKNKLILRPSQERDASRSIIVPHGVVNASLRVNHVEVSIETGDVQDIAHHYYELDPLLCRLTDNGQLKSTLFRTLLHAMTSHCLVDRLTRKTGTEQALDTLREACTNSFRGLDKSEIDILKKIAHLTPVRVFYPPNLKVMQQVSWKSTLPSLSQHESFVTHVFNIFSRARQHEIFYKSDALPDETKFGDSALMRKALFRNSNFRVAGFGTDTGSTAIDTAYTQTAKSRERDVCYISKMVNIWSKDLDVSAHLLREMEGWTQPVLDSSRLKLDALGYDEEWLEAPRDLSKHWCTLVKLISKVNQQQDKYRLMIFLSTLAYSNTMDLRLIQTLLSFATVPALKVLMLPEYDKFDLSQGYTPNQTDVTAAILRNATAFKLCPEAHLPQLDEETDKAETDVRRRHLHEESQLIHANTLSGQLMAQWPSPAVETPTGNNFVTYFRVQDVASDVGSRFETWFRNRELQYFVGQVQNILNSLIPSTCSPGMYSMPKSLDSPYTSRRSKVTWDVLLCEQPPQISLTKESQLSSFSQIISERRDCPKTQALLKHMLFQASDQYERAYGHDMQRSLECLQVSEQECQLLPEMIGRLNVELREAMKRSESNASAALDAIHAAFLGGASLADKIAHDASLWPRIPPLEILKHLSRSDAISSDWKNALIRYGRAITRLQYYKRLCAMNDQGSEFLKELVNCGHEGWTPENYPEWLLFEIENNLLIRPNQAQIAKEMLNPSSGGNTVMQLNMGEGKSSVIVPIVASTLARRENLARVIVLPALSSQMFQILRRKLGGLLDCRVVGMPFSRSLQLHPSQARAIQSLYKECLHDKCVLLCQPEHLLSFDLMGIEKSLADCQDQVGETLVETQKWIDNNTRDIIDESDEVLDVKFELIYTIGLQAGIDFSPDRWMVIMNILQIVDRCVQDARLQRDFAHGFQVNKIRSCTFVRMQILESEAGVALVQMIAREVVDTGIPGLPVWTLSPDVKNDLLKYITDPLQAEPESTSKLAGFFGSTQTRMTLLLLKGLFAHGIIQFVFQHKRWRVNYGLDPSRSMLAVPYRAKDLPALRAEFSHPDVTITLTCLSFYYGGLSDAQLFLCFEELLSSDNPESEYESWVKTLEYVPEAFSKLSGINLSDRPQCIDLLFPCIRHNKAIIDFFLSHLVFPKELKEFPQKLSSSGWDIARSKIHPTTGFSGTNDSRYLLPLSVQQADIPDQVHTNAKVLDCLLQSRNTYQVIPNTGDTFSFLDLVVNAQPDIRVILDVGALVLDWRNDEMAHKWLDCVTSPEVEAVVYFDDDDELAVLSRDGRVQSLQESPMLKQMDKCLVYLDEAHTRGTDLKLPTHYRAAATLGIGLIKDRLVQACMRMRKLAHGQSVMLCAPPEIHRKVMERVGKTTDMAIDVKDVLLWAISNTHKYTRKCVPLWAIQGMRYQNRQVFWADAIKSSQLPLLDTARCKQADRQLSDQQ